MDAIFLTDLTEALPRWAAAFPRLRMRPDLPASADREVLYWLDLDAFGRRAQGIVRDAHEQRLSMVVLSPKPSEDEAFRMLSAGAKGYAHVDAVPEQLKEMAEVVEHGGLWMPPGLVQRLLKFAVGADAKNEARVHPSFDELSPREIEVAMLIGRGLNNREIAEQLEVSERTVKANLTSIFEKLELRDRVQLALWVNRLPIH